MFKFAKPRKKDIGILKNPKRRSFLKNLGLIGAGFAVGRLLNFLPFGKRSTELERLLREYGKESEVAVFGNFVIQETDKELNFFTRDGDRILVLEKD